MFDFAWSEFALIGVVALVFIGPKDLPVAIKAVAEMVKKARRMAGEFQTHVDEMVKEANLGEVRDQFNDLRRMDIKGKILSVVDDDGSIRRTMSQPLVTAADLNLAPPPVPVHDSPAVIAEEAATHAIEAHAVEGLAVEAWPEHTILGPDAAMAVTAGPPAFIPPQLAAAGVPVPPAPPPAFVPPGVVAEAARVRRTASYA